MLRICEPLKTAGETLDGRCPSPAGRVQHFSGTAVCVPPYKRNRLVSASVPADSALNTARMQRPALACFTSRTTESVRPAEAEQVLTASLFSAKTPHKLQKRSRIVLFQDPEHRLGLPESNG